MNSYEAYCLTSKTGVINIELEKVISQDYGHSYYYAREILKYRFELGELAISQDCYYSFSYAFYVLKGRFRLGEKAIIKYYFCEYLVKVMGYDHA